MSTLCALSSLLFLQCIFFYLFSRENVIIVKRGFVGKQYINKDLCCADKVR